jgi:DNA-binding transcriptional LysR family regulator
MQVKDISVERERNAGEVRRNLMSLRKYEYALAVAEEGSVTAAAERLGVAQPSVSQQIRMLESDLGVRLFARTPRGVAVTVAGRAFLKEAEVAVTASRRARAAARAGNPNLTGELIVAAQMGLGSRQLSRALGTLRCRYPNLEVTVFEEPAPADLERLARQGTLDLALVHHVPPECCYEERLLGHELYVAVLWPEHPMLACVTLTLSDLADEPWVRFTTGSVLDAQMTKVLKRAGMSVRTVARASQIATAVRLAAQGMGVTIIPASAVPRGYECLIRPVDPPITEPVVAAARYQPGPAEKALLDILMQEDWSGGWNPDPLPRWPDTMAGLPPNTARAA